MNSCNHSSLLKRIYHSTVELIFPLRYKLQSFTFYIPAPPIRKHGYREKEFDKIFYEFINKGHNIIDVKTQSNTGEDSSGMWIIIITKSHNLKASKLNFDDSFGLTSTDDDELSITPIDDAISNDVLEGLYDLND